MPESDTADIAEESPDELSAELTAAQPACDIAAMEEVRASVQRALFDHAPPARLGRFVLLKPIAGGGMGMIHRAYDPKLERPVALKLLHPRQHGSDRARARLLAEARLLARLAHPHVVPIYEVLELEEQVVLVMELVEGMALAVWQRDTQRSWRDIVAVYTQAGEGLAAAHDLGIVHRDFKPDNAIVGNDGRVRVLDFGLARLTSPDRPNEREAADPAAPPGAAPSLTLSGELPGTIAYMAPEQLAGDNATAQSDQFSFCVALYRALIGAPPFAGADAKALHDNIRAGRFAPASEARVPSWLRTVVKRGLAAGPADRYPRMTELLAELGRDRGRRRSRWAALVALTAAIAFAINLPSDPLAVCERGSPEIVQVWNAERARRVRSALGTIGTPYARVIEDRVISALDSYGVRWSDASRAACRAYRTVQLSDGRFERRRSCLKRRLQDLASAADVLAQLDASSVSNAVDVVARLPAVEACADSDELPDGTDPPPNAAVGSHLVALRAQLSRAQALDRAGRSGDALRLADNALASAQRMAYPPAVLEAALSKGSVLALRGDFADAVAPLALAEELALQHRQLPTAVLAGARRIYVEGMLGVALERLAGQSDVLERLSRGVGNEQHARSRLLNYLGTLYMARNQREQAQRSFSEAKQTMSGPVPVDPELMFIDMNLAMLTRNRTERETLAHAAWQRVRDQLGAQHPVTLHEQYRFAHYIMDPVTSLRLQRDAAELYREFHADRVRERVECLSYQAFLAGDLAERDSAIELYREIAGLANGSTDEDLAPRARLANGHLALDRGGWRDARDQFTAVIAQFAHSEHWWDHQVAAEGHLGASLADDAVGDAAAAAAHLESAIAMFDDVRTRNEDVQPRQQLAFARFRLVRLLRAQHGSRNAARVQALAGQAATFYREANARVYQRRLAELAQ
jgi:eukaryotic-like serine/threonine-protein kinase